MTRFFRFFNVLLAVFFLFNPFLNTVHAANFDPQYLFMHKILHQSDPYPWDEARPESITVDGVNDILNKLGTRGSSKRKVGVSFTFNYNNYDTNVLRQSLINLLNISYSNDGNDTNDSNVPVLIHLDGFEYWDNHPELWNFWDPNMPGFNPDNKNNVEWTSWSSDSAIKISWRNWGSNQIRVAPHPNISSSAFINLSLSALDKLVPVIVSWYQNLPQDKKYLFGGVVVGWEVNIGVNYWYYPNGNNYLNQPECMDPTSGVGSGVQLGYAAVRSANIKTQGTLTSQDLDTAVSNYLTVLTKKIYELGVPRDKIFTHVGADDGTILHPGTVWTTALSALTSYSQPGMSFYSFAGDPGSTPNFNDVLNQIENTQWAAVEWNDWLHTTSADWISSLRNAFAYRNNKFIDYYSWMNLEQYKIDAFKTILSEELSCWTTPADFSKVLFNGEVVTFQWIPGADASDLQQFLLSNYGDLTFSGRINRVNVTNLSVVGMNSYQRPLNPGVYYYSIVNDGCNNSRRRVSGVNKLIIPVDCLPLGDIDCSKKVDFFDLTNQVKKMNQSSTAKIRQDIDSSLSVNSLDMSVLLSNFDKVYELTPTPTFDPVPTSVPIVNVQLDKIAGYEQSQVDSADSKQKLMILSGDGQTVFYKRFVSGGWEDRFNYTAIVDVLKKSCINVSAVRAFNQSVDVNQKPRQTVLSLDGTKYWVRYWNQDVPGAWGRWSEHLVQELNLPNGEVKIAYFNLTVGDEASKDPLTGQVRPKMVVVSADGKKLYYKFFNTNMSNAWDANWEILDVQSSLVGIQSGQTAFRAFSQTVEVDGRPKQIFVSVDGKKYWVRYYDPITKWGPLSSYSSLDLSIWSKSNPDVLPLP